MQCTKAQLPTFWSPSQDKRTKVLKQILFVLLFAIPDWASAIPIQRQLAAHGLPRIEKAPPLEKVAESIAKMTFATAKPVSAIVLNAHLRHLLNQQGISDSAAWLSVLRGPKVLDTEVLSDVLPKLNRQIPPTAVGQFRLAKGDQTVVVTVLLHQAARFDVVALPKVQDTTKPQALQISGQLRSGYFKPMVVIESTQGHVVRQSLLVDRHRRFTMTWRPKSAASSFRVELVAENVSGPRVLNVLTVNQKHPAYGLPVIRVGQDLDVAPPIALYKRIERFRRENGVSTIKFDHALARVAHLHAQFLSERNLLTHRNDEQGHVRQRLSAQGIRPSIMTELLVYAPSPLAAFGALTDSPAHLEEMRRPKMNRVGIGMVDHFYVIVLAQFPTPAAKVD